MTDFSLKDDQVYKLVYCLNCMYVWILFCEIVVLGLTFQVLEFNLRHLMVVKVFTSQSVGSVEETGVKWCFYRIGEAPLMSESHR